jgi:hypothetical protein
MQHNGVIYKYSLLVLVYTTGMFLVISSGGAFSHIFPKTILYVHIQPHYKMPLHKITNGAFQQSNGLMPHAPSPKTSLNYHVTNTKKTAWLTCIH